MVTKERAVKTAQGGGGGDVLSLNLRCPFRRLMDTPHMFCFRHSVCLTDTQYSTVRMYCTVPVRITNIEEIMGDHDGNSNRVKRELSETPEKLRGARREKVTPEKKRSCGRALFLPEEVIDR